ncbi:MAG: HIT family protein [Polynucleobacter sp. 39-45-136]|nr:MAG: HIT family protein [Polynucleobacter sp. 39-45-136]
MKNCVLCKDELKPEEGQLIWRGDDCRIILVNDPDLPGFCRVIWNRHISEMTDLTPGERDHLMTLVFAVEEAIRKVMNPDKVNIAALGNMVPHIHWPKTQQTLGVNVEARKQLAKDLPSAIKSAIAALS